jgi:LPS export ABC transporter protein LptC
MTGRRWVAIGIVLAVVPLIIWALLVSPVPQAPGPEPAAPVAPATPGPASTPPAGGIPPVQVDGSAISAVDAQGRPQWDIRAAAVSVDGAAGLVTLVQVDGTYFEAGRPSVRFAAPRGTFEIGTRNVTLDGGVRARAVTSGRTLEATRVRWTPGNRQIEATGNVVLTQPGVVARADRLLSDITLERTRLLGNVRVTATE